MQFLFNFILDLISFYYDISCYYVITYLSNTIKNIYEFYRIIHLLQIVIQIPCIPIK